MSKHNDHSMQTAFSREQVLRQVKQIVADTQSISVDSLQESTNLDADLNFDSLERVELAMEIEEEFDIEISDEMEQEIRTIKNIVDGVMTVLKSQESCAIMNTKEAS
jgi:acyl carrier protein